MDDMLSDTGDVIRDCLDPEEQFVERPGVKAMLKKVQETCQPSQHEHERVHKEYRGSDRPRGWERKLGNTVHRGGTLKDPAEWMPCATVIRSLPGSPHTFGNHTNSGGLSSYSNVRFKADSQLPYIQMEITPAGEVSGSTRAKVYVHIFPSNLSRGERRPIQMTSGASGKLKERALAVKALPPLVTAARADMVNETTLFLLGPTDSDLRGSYSRPRITGDITTAELDVFVQRGDSDATLAEHERLLGLIHSGLAINRTEFIQQNNFNQYFYSALLLCNKFGSYWYIKQQCPDVKMDDNDFPFGVNEPPRFLVTGWGPKPPFQMDINGGAVTPEPVSWTAFNIPDVWPSPEDLEFVLRLGLARDCQFQASYLTKLSKAHEAGTEAFFKRNPASATSYLAQIYTRIERSRLQAVLPRVNARVRIWLESGTTLDGVVVESPRGCHADFCVHVTAKMPLELSDEQAYDITIKFVDDSAATLRRMQALHEIRAGHPDRTTGVYLPKLLLGAQMPPSHTAKKLVDPVDLDAFKFDLSRWGLNPEQQDGAVKTFEAEDDVVVIYGPSSTGKTLTICAAIEAQIKRGKQVLACGQSNEVVNALVASWEAQADEVYHRGHWAIWKGAYLKSEFNQEDFTPWQTTEDEESLDANAFLVRRAIEAAGDTTDTSFRKGFSFRRWQTVRAISEDPRHELQGDAVEYIRLLQVNKRSTTEKSAMLALEDRFSALFLTEAKVIFSTCSLACHPTLTKYFRPKVAFVDEAGEATTPDFAMPLVAFKNEIQTVVLSGDDHHRTPVVVSVHANEGYKALSKSLFVTLIDKHGINLANDQRYCVCPLSTQYRMHPDIGD